MSLSKQSFSKNLALLVSIFIVAGVFSSFLYLNIFHPVTTSTSPTSTIVEVNPSFISLDLEIQSSEGVSEFRQVAVIEVDDVDSLLFRIVDPRIEKLTSLSLSGKVKLESSNKTYEIDMPCILAVNTSCPRITMIIPGYDAPLTIESGRYLLTIMFSWREAKDFGKVSLRLLTRAYDASIVNLGSSEPEDTTNWFTAEGSTRSFALQVDKIEDVADNSGFGRFKVYAWVFQTVGEDVEMFRFELASLDTGFVKAVLNTPVEKKGVYYHVMLLIIARQGSYRLILKHPVELSIDIKVHED